MTLPRTTILTWLIFSAASLAWAEPQSGPASKEGREATPAVVNPAIRSELRATLSLDGPWDFCTDHKRQGESEGWQVPGKALPGLRQIQVPGCWEAQGVGEPGRRRQVHVLSGRREALRFRHHPEVGRVEEHGRQGRAALHGQEPR
jgi:hypothetical protein